MAVGLAVGVTPLYGLHLPIVLAICLPLHLDSAVAYVAANISLPFVAPLLSAVEIEIGAVLRTGHGIPFDVERIHALGLRAFAIDLAIGTIVLAPALSAVGAILTYGAVALVWRRRQEPFAQAAARVAARYAEGKKAAYHYVRAKLASDPVARLIAARAGTTGLGDVVDVGCGRGQLALLLLELGDAAHVTGIDWDDTKIAAARRASEGTEARFEMGDVTSAAMPACDTALLVDVLHYLTDEQQDDLLRRAARAARKRVLVRELDPDRGIRSALTRLQERVTTSLGMNRGARVRPRPIPSLTRVLSEEGFDSRVEPCWGATPLSNVLITATRRARA